MPLASLTDNQPPTRLGVQLQQGLPAVGGEHQRAGGEVRGEARAPGAVGVRGQVPDVRRSQALLLNLGFRQEGGLLRDRVVIRGMRRSVLMYAVLAPDWWAHRARGCVVGQGSACAE